MTTTERLSKLYNGGPWTKGSSIEDLLHVCEELTSELTEIFNADNIPKIAIAEKLLAVVDDHEQLMAALRDAHEKARHLDPDFAQYLALVGADMGDAELMLNAAAYAVQQKGIKHNSVYLSIGLLRMAADPAAYADQNFRVLAIINGKSTLCAAGFVHEFSSAAFGEGDDDEGYSGPGIVVIEELGGGEGRMIADVRKDFKAILRRRVPLVGMPDVTRVYADLVCEAPHLRDVIGTILRDTAASDVVRIRPTILVGEPGCGKTRLARRLAEVLEVPYRIIPCGGVHDGAFGGTSRQWHTGRPSVPLGIVRDTKTSNPFVVLDEIEKASKNRHHGSLFDIILGMLEAENSRKYWDLYAESHVDISYVNWLMTANSVADLDPALRDRCRILHVPDPSPEHLMALLPSVLDDVMAERGLGPEWTPVPSAADVELIGETWGGGSVRKLRRVVEAYLDACDSALAH